MRYKNTLILTALIASAGILPAEASKATVRRSGDTWTLLVDGKPYFIKGVGCNDATGKNGEDYLKMAKDLGANTVRTWGDTTREYLDKAHAHGLKVNAGIWFNGVREGFSESYQEAEVRLRLKQEALNVVKSLKDHPALLTWNLGNEVFAFTDEEAEKEAFGKFLEDLIRAVHEEDPDHPVIYASADVTDFPYLQKHVPSLDIVGANVYGNFTHIRAWMVKNKFNKPIVATEYGPLGAWEQPKDENDLPFDPYDQNKAGNYRSLWSEISGTPGSIGGFAFVIGEQRNQNSLTWFNMNVGTKKRQSYWAVYTAYTDKLPDNRPPKIALMKINPKKNLSAGDEVEVNAKVTDPEGDRLTFEYFLTNIESDPVQYFEPQYFYPSKKIKSPGHAVLTLPQESGSFRLYMTVSDDKGNIAVANQSIQIN